MHAGRLLAYFRLDVGGFRGHEDTKWNGWRLHAAFEHENDD